jgi:hypothetical protein
MKNYAYHASLAFNRQLDDTLRAITRETEVALGANLVALILGGGYGRGEGGVEMVDGEEKPYNDLDLTLVVRRPASIAQSELNRISSTYASELGIHVDYSRPLTIPAIRHWPPWLVWHDLLNGHQVLSGPRDILTANAPDAVRTHPPPIEALRLLLNRGAGLLWATRVMRFAEPEPDRGFTRRNAFKLALALGDALLVAYGRFATPYRGRDARLEALAEAESAVAALDLLPLYRDALTFKFSPHALARQTVDADTLADLTRRWACVMLLTEQRRTGSAWSDIQHYAADRFIREIDMHRPREILRNFARNLRIGQVNWRHPREALYRDITQLLAQTTPADDWRPHVHSFIKIWERYN